MNLYLHLWQAFIRNQRWRRNLLSKILLAILLIYFFLLFLIVGLNIDKILSELGGNPIDNFNSILLYYLIVDLILRCLLQPLPTIAILPYIRLRIRRNTIINFLLFRCIVNIFNLIPLLIIIPFSTKLLLPQYGLKIALVYLSGLCLLILINNSLAVLIGFLSQKKLVYIIIPFIISAFLVIVNKWWTTISIFSITFGELIAQGRVILFGVLIATIILIIYVIKRFLNKNFYIDDLKSNKKPNILVRVFDTHIFKGLGEIGRYLSLEVCLLIRNKRPRQMLVMLPIFLAYFLFFILKGNIIRDQFSLLLMSTMLIGFGASMYGQFIFSWDSSYFDNIMTRKINFINYVKVKYYLLLGLSIMTFIPLFIVFFLTKKIDLYLLCSLLFFIMGVNSFIIMFLGTFNNGRIDLSKSRFFNYEGVRANQFLITLIFMLLPMGIYSLFSYFFCSIVGDIAIALPGLVFLIFHHLWISKIIVPQFKNRKYKNLEGYRKLSF
jgi:hypothetical protein